MSDCIFCKIIAGEIPASKVYEDEQVLAFLDISQVTLGHTLVRAKRTLSQSFGDGCYERQPTLCPSTKSSSKSHESH